MVVWFSPWYSKAYVRYIAGGQLEWSVKRLDEEWTMESKLGKRVRKYKKGLNDREEMWGLKTQDLRSDIIGLKGGPAKEHHRCIRHCSITKNKTSLVMKISLEINYMGKFLNFLPFEEESYMCFEPSVSEKSSEWKGYDLVIFISFFSALHFCLSKTLRFMTSPGAGLVVERKTRQREKSY